MGTLIGGVVSLGATVGQSYISRELRLNEPLPTSRPAGDALRVTKVTHQIGEGQSWALPGPVDLAGLAELNELNKREEGLAYMRERGGIDVGEAQIEIEIEGNRQGPVRITGITALTECREPLYEGTLFRDTNQGGDAVLPMGFDLDQGEPVARRLEEDPGGPPRFGDPYFQTRKVTLDRGEQETFSMSVRTDTKFCDFQFRFDLIVDGKPTSQLVGNGAKPFQVTGEGTCQKYQNVYYGWPFGGHSGVSLEALDGGHWIEEKDTYLLEEGLEVCT